MRPLQRGYPRDPPGRPRGLPRKPLLHAASTGTVAGGSLLLNGILMLSTSNVAIQFGAKPLFEHVTVKFADGNRVWVDRCEWQWQVHPAEGAGRGARSYGGRRNASAGLAPRQVAPGPVRVRRPARARRRHAGPRGNVEGHAGTRSHLQRCQRDGRRLHEGRGAGGKVCELRRLRRRGARRFDPHRCRCRRIAAQRPDARSGSRAEAARVARAGVVLAAGRAAARRAHQQPGHQLDPVARRTS